MANFNVDAWLGNLAPIATDDQKFRLNLLHILLTNAHGETEERDAKFAEAVKVFNIFA